jgi:phage pi2 protein 07
LLTKEPRIKKNSKLRWKHKDLKSKRREKSNASENYKKKLLIVKPKLMPFVPSVLLRRGRDRLVSVKD